MTLASLFIFTLIAPQIIKGQKSLLCSSSLTESHPEIPVLNPIGYGWNRAKLLSKTYKTGSLSRIGDYKPKMCCGCCELRFQNWTQFMNSNKEKAYHISLLTTSDSLYYKNTLVFAFWNSPGLRHLLDLISPSSVLFEVLYIPDTFSLHRVF